ncbi:MAG: hypothetical protein MJH10_11885 [Epibacterium sp.]|nr:hypothetical protein [Epibacterium sp.]NQX74247.1 hypothetical protein [Epibacterium sp.]
MIIETALTFFVMVPLAWWALMALNLLRIGWHEAGPLQLTLRVCVAVGMVWSAIEIYVLVESIVARAHLHQPVHVWLLNYCKVLFLTLGYWLWARLKRTYDKIHNPDNS